MFICSDAPEHEMDRFPFNYSQNADFVSFLMNITSTAQKLWFDDKTAKWQGDSNPKYVQTLTRHGIGFTFNTLDLDKQLDTNT